MDLQAIFDRGVAGVLKQGCPSVDSDTAYSCRYRVNGGLRCALGWSIPDESYTPEMEGLAPALGNAGNKINEAIQLAEILGAISDNDCKALQGFQMCHDSASDGSNDNATFLFSFKRDARGFATQYGLNTNVLDSVAP